MPISSAAVDLDSTRLFRVRTVLAVLPKDVFGMSISVLNPVEVKDDTGETIGWASVYARRNELLADLVFRYDHPVRFDIETNAKRLYARVNGIAELITDPFEADGALCFDGWDLFPTDTIQVRHLEVLSKPGWTGQPALGEVVL